MTETRDVVLFSGPLHVITYMGEAVKEMTERDPTGDPVRLAYVEKDLRDTQDAMDRVYATGRCEWVHNRYGWVHLMALRELGEIVGLGAYHAYARSPYEPRPRLRDLVPAHEQVG